MRFSAILVGALDVEGAGDLPLADFDRRACAERLRARRAMKAKISRAGGQSFSRAAAKLAAVRRYSGRQLLARRRIFSRLLGLPRFLRRRSWPPLFSPPPLPFAVASARPAWFFWPAILCPPPAYPRSSRIASSSVIVSGDMPLFQGRVDVAAIDIGSEPSRAHGDRSVLGKQAALDAATPLPRRFRGDKRNGVFKR